MFCLHTLRRSCFREAMPKCGVRLLEPIMKVGGRHCVSAQGTRAASGRVPPLKADRDPCLSQGAGAELRKQAGQKFQCGAAAFPF